MGELELEGVTDAVLALLVHQVLRLVEARPCKLWNVDALAYTSLADDEVVIIMRWVTMMIDVGDDNDDAAGVVDAEVLHETCQ